MEALSKFRNITPVELPYISCKNLAEVVHIRHYLQESCKNLGFQTNLSDSCRSDISCRFRRFLQDSCRSRHFLQDSWTDLAEVVHIRHYLQESCKNLGFQTNLSDSCRSDISCRFRRFLQDSCRSRHFLQDSWTDLARQCLKLERYSARKCLENVEIVFSNKLILNQEYSVEDPQFSQDPEDLFTFVCFQWKHQNTVSECLLSTSMESVIRKRRKSSSPKIHLVGTWALCLAWLSEICGFFQQNTQL